MAQDFQALFQVGESDKMIIAIDSDGVAFAAIQGLNEKLEEGFKERDAKIKAQQKQIEELKQIVCALKSDAAVCREEK